MSIDWVELDNGRIRLACGDCLDALSGVSFDCLCCDPPYGVKHKPGSEKQSKIRGGISGDEHPPQVAWMASYPAIVWGANNFCDQLPRSTGWLVWFKHFPECAHHSQAELAWTNTVRTIRHHSQAYHGFMRQRDGWFHQHQKPVDLMEWCLSFMPSGSRVVCDPYMGSGTTCLAAIKRGMEFVGCEIDRNTFDTALSRITAELARQPLFPPPPAPKQLGLLDERTEI